MLTNRTNNMDENDAVYSYLQPYLEDIDLLLDDDPTDQMDVDDDEDKEDDDSTLPSERRKKHKYDRIDWKQHLVELEAAGPYQFHYRYHMSQAAFSKLVDLLGDMINVNEAKSRASTNDNDPIAVQLVVGAGLRYLGGEYLKSIRDIFGISPSYTRRIVRTFIASVLDCKALDITLPVLRHELKQKADQFNDISHMPGKMLYGCVGAIDGWLTQINKPSNTTDADYFSGHYNCFGLNVQAVCDAYCKFTHLEVAAPGRTNDVRAYKRCVQLKNWIDNLPDEYFCVGDNAYPLSNNLLIPFSGANRSDKHKDAYNFYLSQLRIQIEMTFGRMTARWRLFHRNLDCSLPLCTSIILAAGRLHNFITDVDGPGVIVDPKIGNGDEMFFQPTDNHTLPEQPVRISSTPTLDRRDSILSQVIGADLHRPCC